MCVFTYDFGWGGGGEESLWPFVWMGKSLFLFFYYRFNFLMNYKVFTADRLSLAVYAILLMVDG